MVITGEGTHLTYGFENDAVQLDRPQLESLAGVRARECQQLVDDPGQPPRLAGQITGRLSLLRFRHARIPCDKFDVAEDGGQRGAQLVSRVGHKALLRPVRLFQAGEHLVKGAGKPAELVAAAGIVQPARKAPRCGDGPCGLRHGGHRSKHARGDCEATQARGGHPSDHEAQHHLPQEGGGGVLAL